MSANSAARAPLAFGGAGGAGAAVWLAEGSGGGGWDRVGFAVGAGEGGVYTGEGWMGAWTGGIAWVGVTVVAGKDLGTVATIGEGGVGGL